MHSSQALKLKIKFVGDKNSHKNFCNLLKSLRSQSSKYFSKTQKLADDLFEILKNAPKAESHRTFVVLRRESCRRLLKEGNW